MFEIGDVTGKPLQVGKLIYWVFDKEAKEHERISEADFRMYREANTHSLNVTVELPNNKYFCIPSKEVP